MASGDFLAVFTPLSNEPPSSGFMTLDLRNGHPVLDAAGASDESAVFTGVLPANYAAGGVTVDVYWTCDEVGNGSTDDVDIDVAFERMAVNDLDIDADSFVAVNSDDGTLVPTTAGVIQKSTVTFTDGADMDSVAAGEPFRIKITRDGTNDNEDADINILAVVIKET